MIAVIRKVTTLSIVFVACLCTVTTLKAEKLIHMNFNDVKGNQSLVNRGTVSVTGTMVTNVSYSVSRPTVSRAGYSASFDNLLADGLNYVSLGDVDELDGMTDITFCLWLRPQAKVSTSWSQRLLNKGTYGFGLTLSGIYSPGLMIDGYNTGLGGMVILPGHWTFLAVTYNGTLTTNNVLCYTGDGGALSAPTTNTLDRGACGSNSDEFWLGHHSVYDPGNSYHGDMDNVRIYNEVLDAAALATIMAEDDASGSKALPPDLGKLIHMDFNDTMGEQSLVNKGSMALNERFGPNASYTNQIPSANHGGYGAAFTGSTTTSTNYIPLTDGDEYDELRETWYLTACTWIRPGSSMPYAPRVFSYRGSIGNHGWYLTLANHGKVPQFTANGYGAGTIGSNLTKDQWTFIAVVYDGTKTTDNILFYQGTDDTLAVTTNTFNQHMIRATGGNMRFWLGDDADPRDSKDGGVPFHGQLDNVRVYNRLLNLTELETIMSFKDVVLPQGTIIIVQ